MKNILTNPVSVVVLLLVFSSSVFAEPYLAVRNGLKCNACHVNPTGGGKRADAGSVYGQRVLPAEVIDDAWNGHLNSYLAIGADFRASLRHFKRNNSDNESAFETERASLYLEITPIVDRLTLYIDELLSPSASNREAYALMWNQHQDTYLKAGRFFLPYGLRLEDDSAFIRRVSSINFANADNGVEVGYEAQNWSIQTAITNGTNGGSENNTDKQISIRIEHIQSDWRGGVSINQNSGVNDNERKMWNLFGAARWIGVEWLAEYDLISDISASSEIDRTIALFEVNYLYKKGQNLKLTLEYYDPDTNVSEDAQTRNSLVWEYTPLSSIQFRVGLRLAEGIPQATDDQNDDLFFIQLHGWL